MQAHYKLSQKKKKMVTVTSPCLVALAIGFAIPIHSLVAMVFQAPNDERIIPFDFGHVTVGEGFTSNFNNDSNNSTRSSSRSSTRRKRVPSPDPVLFYQHHFDHITSLVNPSTGLVWNATNKKKQFGIFLDSFSNMYEVPRGKEFEYDRLDFDRVKRSKIIYAQHFCDVVRIIGDYRHHQKMSSSSSSSSSSSLPHVLIVGVNNVLAENCGTFSEIIPNKTGKCSKSLEYKWNKAGCSLEDVAAYLDHPDTKAVVTTQYQSYDHPKVHSIPLGIKKKELLVEILKTYASKSRDSIPDAIREANAAFPQREHQNDTISNTITKTTTTTTATFTRPQWLMINCAPRGMREAALERVIHNFGGTVQNTYQAAGPGRKVRLSDYLDELKRSKFILSPGGIGLDCYRHWEALYMGTIPVLEHLNRKDGWYRTLSDLPVAWIDSYDNLTPQWLQYEYARIIQNYQRYNYEKLTKGWWIQMIERQLLN